jgi:DNA-binding NarL/FixJ family response regulator
VHSISVILVGEADRSEFLETRRTLAATARLWLAPDPEAAEALLSHQSVAPDVIVLAESYPGQFSAAAIDRLRTLAPLARIVALLGSWCEGETRTGRPCPGAVRVYWHQGCPRSAQELARIAQGRVSSWTLPATATEEERLLTTSEFPLPTGQGLVAIHTPHASMAEWLSAACRLGGYSTVRLDGPRWAQVAGVAAGVFDATDLGPLESERLTRMAHQLGRPPIVALLDFPRTTDRDRALACGATAVLSKPLVLEDLLWCLKPACGTRP